MRISSEVIEAKRQFVLEILHRDANAAIPDLNRQVTEKFKTGMNFATLYKLRNEVRKLTGWKPPAEQPAQVLQDTDDATCAKCGKKGPVKRDFGFRTVNGEKKAQSWCRDCRKAHARPPDAKNGDQKPAETPAPVAAVRDQVPVVNLQADVPPTVVTTMNQLLAAMRESRVENIQLHISGSSTVRVLRSNEEQLHFGGRRAVDPKPNVQLAN
jgi:hypothetical protein